MRDWERHWTTHPRRFAPHDHLRQVGKTVGGVPIEPSQLDRIVHDILRGLALEPDDVLLDLCCGNGLLTSRLARHCRRVVGVDYSPPLLEIAARDHQPSNVDYIEASALRLADLPRSQPFNKVLIYEALQHFSPDQLQLMLPTIRARCAARFRLLLGSVPDRERLWRFYDTPARRVGYLWRASRGAEAIGTWWRRDDVADTLAIHGLHSRFVEQSPQLHTAHYRFDVVATPAIREAGV